MVVTAEGYVFYASPTIQDFLGFHQVEHHQGAVSVSLRVSLLFLLLQSHSSFSFQSDVVHQSVFELIHTDDRALFRRQLHFALNPAQGSQDGSGNTTGEE